MWVHHAKIVCQWMLLPKFAELFTSILLTYTTFIFRHFNLSPTSHSSLCVLSWKVYFLAADDNRVNLQSVNELWGLKCWSFEGDKKTCWEFPKKQSFRIEKKAKKERRDIAARKSEWISRMSEFLRKVEARADVLFFFLNSQIFSWIIPRTFSELSN